MNFKLSTKEKFHEININEAVLSANLTADFYDKIAAFAQQAPYNTILVFNQIHEVDEVIANQLVELHQLFYSSDYSFVVTEIQKPVLAFLQSANIAEDLNITPTLSEAWDIVQMEEVERELMRDFDFDDDTEA